MDDGRSTLNILNPTRSYGKSATKLYVDVPKSTSTGYKQRLQEDWRLRIWSEIGMYSTHGGVNVFVTFTYRPECRPYFDVIEDGKSYHIPCFDKYHYEKFMNDFRGYFYRKYGLAGPSNKKDEPKKNRKGMLVYHSKLPFKCIWCCEYGTSEGRQHAPHYHAILHIPEEYLACDELSCPDKIMSFIRHCWPYGFTLFSKKEKGGLFVQRSFAAKYVSKYCFKQYQYYINSDVHDFLFDKDNNRIESHFEMMKGKLPTHWQGQFYGIGLVDLFDNYDAYKNGIDFKFTDNLKSGKTVPSNIPQYIERKILYRQREDKTFELTKKGVEWKLRKFVETFRQDASKFEEFLKKKNLSKYITDDDITSIFGNSRYHIYSLSQYISTVYNILGNRTFEELYIYSKVWKGLCSEDIGELVYLDDLHFDEFLNESFMQYQLNLSHSLDDYDEDGYFKMISKNHDLSKFWLFNKCGRFNGFDTILELYDIVRTFYRDKLDALYYEKLEQRKRLIMETA